jgi:UDPglucose 6-dehydrogenase
VCGLWHLGSVTAASLAAAGFNVTGLDPDVEVIQSLNRGIPPLFEPGLAELLGEGLKAGNLSFTAEPASALTEADIMWVTYDTPVDEDDNADVEFVLNRIVSVLPFLQDGVSVIISSQVPVGFTRRIERIFVESYPGKSVSFVYSPENLRLGKAIEVFRRPDRIVVGLRREADKERVTPVFTSLCNSIEWMRTESAEMTKHAINAFLATSVAFANELALLCERTCADAGEVERGLKSEKRIGPGAYLSPGPAFAGGTLARDVSFLKEIGRAFGLPTILFNAVRESNDYHKSWVKRRLKDIYKDLAGCKVAVLGLTYKPGTDTLRRSGAVELCKWLTEQGAIVRSYDPALKKLSEELSRVVNFRDSLEAALAEADCLVIGTQWPVFKDIRADTVTRSMREPVVIDTGAFLPHLGEDPRIKYFAVGRGQADET